MVNKKCQPNALAYRVAKLKNRQTGPLPFFCTTCIGLRKFQSKLSVPVFLLLPKRLEMINVMPLQNGHPALKTIFLSFFNLVFESWARNADSLNLQHRSGNNEPETDLAVVVAQVEEGPIMAMKVASSKPSSSSFFLLSLKNQSAKRLTLGVSYECPNVLDFSRIKC